MIPHIYKAKVVANVDADGNVVEDSEYSNRVKVLIDGLHDEDTNPADLPWADCLGPLDLSKQGEAKFPPPDTEVIVGFLGGEPSMPVVLGTWLRQQDVRNASNSDYTAGDDTKVVEGRKVSHARGDQVISTTRDFKVFSEGKVRFKARRKEEDIDGFVQSSDRGRTHVSRGDVNLETQGKTTFDAIDDVRVGVAGFTNFSTLLPLDALSFGGMTFRSVLSTISLKNLGASVTGVNGVEMATTDPTGLFPISIVAVNIASALISAPLVSISSFGAIEIAAGGVIDLTAGGAVNFNAPAFNVNSAVTRLGAAASIPAALSVPVEARLVALEVAVAALSGGSFVPVPTPVASTSLLIL